MLCAPLRDISWKLSLFHLDPEVVFKSQFYIATAYTNNELWYSTLQKYTFTNINFYQNLILLNSSDYCDAHYSVAHYSVSRYVVHSVVVMIFDRCQLHEEVSK
jgi:hypothetical protein